MYIYLFYILSSSVPSHFKFLKTLFLIQIKSRPNTHEYSLKFSYNHIRIVDHIQIKCIEIGGLTSTVCSRILVHSYIGSLYINIDKRICSMYRRKKGNY